MKCLRKAKTAYNILKYRLLEKVFKDKEGGQIKYLYFNKRNQRSLLICFSAFPPGNMPVYNYVNGFQKLPLDRLYIADTFGFRASYYLYEHGENKPEILTCALIDHILKLKNYQHIYTAGTSKGGTCAIYYGLRYNARDIFAGACQYYLGNYLSVPVHIPILQAMMDSTEEVVIQRLNEVMPNLLESYSHSKTVIHLIYSKKEPTYKDHIQYLIEKLDKCHIPFEEIELNFEKHNDVGLYFLPVVNEFFKKIKISAYL